eukprot:254470-Ditylum_brightwellii.AAC.1
MKSNNATHNRAKQTLKMGKRKSDKVMEVKEDKGKTVQEVENGDKQEKFGSGTVAYSSVGKATEEVNHTLKNRENGKLGKKKRVLLQPTGMWMEIEEEAKEIKKCKDTRKKAASCCHYPNGISQPGHGASGKEEIKEDPNLNKELPLHKIVWR